MGFFDRIGENISNAPPEAWFTLAQALAANPNVGQGLAQGLAGFGGAVQDNKKKRGLATALGGMASSIPDNQRPIFEALTQYAPETLLQGYASKLFDKKEHRGPFEGTGVESSAMNILLDGQSNPQMRASPEYMLAWRKIMEPQVIRDAAGNMSLYTPPPPRGIAPPIYDAANATTVGNQQTQPSVPPAQIAPSMQNRGLTQPPANLAPDSPGQFYNPDMHPELDNPPPVSDKELSNPQDVKTDNGGTVTPLPNTSPLGGEEAKNIRQAIDTTIPSVKSTLQRYKSLLKETGPLDRVIGLGEKNARAQSVHTNLLLQLKELFNLGVLNGPDYMLMTKMVDPPDSINALMRGTKGLEGQLSEVENYLETKTQEWLKRAKSGRVTGIANPGAATQPSARKVLKYNPATGKVE